MECENVDLNEFIKQHFRKCTYKFGAHNYYLVDSLENSYDSYYSPVTYSTNSYIHGANYYRTDLDNYEVFQFFRDNDFSFPEIVRAFENLR